MLQGEAKRAYQREYMRRKRAGEPTRKPKQPKQPPKQPKPWKPWKPTKRMVDQVRYWFRASNLSGLGHKIIAGLDPGDEAEALRRYKAHLDERERERNAPPAPTCCSFCGKPASGGLGFVASGDGCLLICATCTEEAAAIFAEKRKRITTKPQGR